MTIITEELSFGPHRRALALEHGRNMAARTYFAATSGAVHNLTTSQNGPANTRTRWSISFSAYRAGIMVAYDWHNAEILYSNVEKILGGNPDAVASTLRMLRDSNQMTTTRLQQQAAKIANANSRS
ncbi:hypothetical protein TARUN_6227 [Trichoderma arundinaceum]|uniref:Uncharacterized protein n=1 Tax=Trichoderma arundinaceum TaxID=490622 RepID=A0A395NJM2_TRIAR|nr:hypothetical protein TARUN_6227 [Trichoderma arundinaceum]